METPQLLATTRTIIGKQVKQLRDAGKLPAIAYGNDVKNQVLAIDQLEYQKVYHAAGTSTLVDLVVDGAKPVKVLLHEPQSHPTKLQPLHADLYIVKMTEKLQTDIPLHFVGESEAVTLLDGTLTTHLDAVEVECYPDKLVPEIEVDVTSLKTFEDIIRVEDIKAPDGIEIRNDPEEVVVTVVAPRSEEELAALEEAPTGEAADEAAVSSVEVEEKGKEEAEETQE